MDRRGLALILGALAAPLISAPPAPAVSRPAQGGVYAVPEHAPAHCTARVCVHWVDTTDDAPDLADGDGDGAPDAVERTADAAEEALTRQAAVGWPAPRPDGTRGGDARTDLYLAEMGGAIAYMDDGRGDPGISGFVILDDEIPGPGSETGLVDLLIHELNHVITYGINGLASNWLLESTAVWMEERAAPDLDLWLRYMPTWAERSENPLGSPYGRKHYGDAVWHHWLAARYGPGIVRDVWDRLPDDREDEADGLVATDESIRAHGGRGIAPEFADYSASVPEWRVIGHPVGNLAALPDAERVATATPGGPAVDLTVYASTFALIDVPPPAAGELRLEARVPAGDPGAIALVGREGDPRTGTVATRLVELPEGGTGTVTLEDPGRFARITAVLVNAARPGYDPRRPNPDRSASALVTAHGDPPPRPARTGTATGAGGDATGGAGILPLDRTAPGLRLRAPRRVRLRTLLEGLRLNLRASERARATFTLAHGGRRIARTTLRLPAAAPRRATLRPGRAARRRLAATRHRRLRLALRVRVTDAAGNARTLRRTVVAVGR